MRPKKYAFFVNHRWVNNGDIRIFPQMEIPDLVLVFYLHSRLYPCLTCCMETTMSLSTLIHPRRWGKDGPRFSSEPPGKYWKHVKTAGWLLFALVATFSRKNRYVWGIERVWSSLYEAIRQHSDFESMRSKLSVQKCA